MFNGVVDNVVMSGDAVLSFRVTGYLCKSGMFNRVVDNVVMSGDAVLSFKVTGYLRKSRIFIF